MLGGQNGKAGITDTIVKSQSLATDRSLVDPGMGVLLVFEHLGCPAVLSICTGKLLGTLSVAGQESHLLIRQVELLAVPVRFPFCGAVGFDAEVPAVRVAACVEITVCGLGI